MADGIDINNASFTIFGAVEGHDAPLIMSRLSFARIIDDIVVPFETGKPFFIDGVPVTKEKIRKIKIIRERQELKLMLGELHRKLRIGTPQVQKDIADQYYVRVEAIIRDQGEDVTSQVIKAFDISIRPKLKDYLPNRQELIQAAMLVFAEALKVLGSRVGS